MEKVGKKATRDFIKAFSCAYSVTLNLEKALGLEENVNVLQSVLGFSAGISTIGDICGTINGGIAVLGEKFPDKALPAWEFYILCSEYFRRMEERLPALSCGKVHGGNDLGHNFRRAILTGKIIKCMAILNHGSDILVDLARKVEVKNFEYYGNHDLNSIKRLNDFFDEQSFHCCRSAINEIADPLDIDKDQIISCSRGFCGGIGFNGTICGAIAAGVLCLGLKEGVDLSKAGYKNTVKLAIHGLVKSEAVFQDEKLFMPASLFTKCKEIYNAVTEKYGGAHCQDILNLKLDTEDGSQKYIKENKISLCRDVIKTVADTISCT